VTINLDPGERKLYEHKLKIVAAERRVVGTSATARSSADAATALAKSWRCFNG